MTPKQAMKLSVHFCISIRREPANNQTSYKSASDPNEVSEWTNTKSASNTYEVRDWHIQSQ